MTARKTPDTAAVKEEQPAAVPGTTLHGPECFTQEQREQLVRDINPKRVRSVSRGGRAAAYLEAYDVRAHLDRIFGFANWSTDTTDIALAFEEAEGRTRTRKKDGKEVEEPYTAWTICYRCTVRLTVNCPHGVPIATYAGVAADVSDAQPQRGDAHHNALAASESTALKRAASNLGDQFGLSLYRKGSVKPLVGRTLVAPAAPVTDNLQGRAPRPDEHITEQLPAETDASAEPEPAAVEAQVTEMNRVFDETSPAEAEGAPRGPHQIRHDAELTTELPVNERKARLTGLMTELARLPASAEKNEARVFLIQQMREVA